MRHILKRLPRLSGRCLCMMVLVIAYMLYDLNGSLFRAPMLILFLPWGCGVAYAAIQSYKGKLGLANGLLIATSACLVMAALVSRDLSQTTLYALGGEVVCMLGVGIVPNNTDQETLRREMLCIAWTMILFLLPFMVLSIISVFTGHQFMISGTIVGLKTAGRVQSRVYVFANPNIGAQRALLCLLLAVYALYASTKRWQRALLIFSMVVFILVLAHTQSRTCNVLLGVALGAMAFRAIYRRFHGKKWCVPVGLLTWGAMVGVALFVLNLLFWVDVHVALGIAQAEDPGLSRIATKGIIGMWDISDNGRTEIWKFAYQYLKLHPNYLFIGTGAGNVTAQIGVDFSKASNWAHLHNALIETLVRGGIPMLLCVIGFLVLLVRPCICMLLARETDGDRGLYVVPILVGVLVLMMISESQIIIRPTLANLIFFLVVGRVFYADRRKTIGPVD